MKSMTAAEFENYYREGIIDNIPGIEVRIIFTLKQYEKLLEARGLLLRGIGMKTSDSRFECGAVYALGWAQGLFWQSRHGGDFQTTWPPCTHSPPDQPGARSNARAPGEVETDNA